MTREIRGEVHRYYRLPQKFCRREAGEPAEKILLESAKCGLDARSTRGYACHVIGVGRKGKRAEELLGLETAETAQFLVPAPRKIS